MKTDTRGRMRTSRERREALLEEFGRSGMSGQQFAKWAGLKYSTFASWRKNQQRAMATATQVPSTGKPVQWVEAVVLEPLPSSTLSTGLMIELGRGLRLSVGDANQARLAGVVLCEVLQGTKLC